MPLPNTPLPKSNATTLTITPNGVAAKATAGPPLLVMDDPIPSENSRTTATEPQAVAGREQTARGQRVYIETVGCQMNVLDSELVVAQLLQNGYVPTDDIQEADTILYNTCSVRQHAEDKIYSALGRAKKYKDRRPEVTIGVLGCMAQKDQKTIFRRAPHVDIVVGPGQLSKVSELLTAVREDRGPQISVSLPRTGGSRETITASFTKYDPGRDPVPRTNGFQAFVRIMMGCDKFCTYCIVPSVRGPEQSRPPEAIMHEARLLVDQGVREITLLGQTVNSYKYSQPDGRAARLSDLLEGLHDLNGLERIKFLTNYPNDMTDDLLFAMRDLPKVSRYLHVPAQSGCDLMLKKMKRGYTVAQYEEMLARIRDVVPDASVSSDFIVGFSGETDESYQRTVDLVRRARFKNSFIFKYSARSGTKADLLYIDDVPEEVKKQRNNELLAIQTAISLEDNQRFLNRAVGVLVEGRSKTAVKRAARANENAARANENAVSVSENPLIDSDILPATNSELVMLDGMPTSVALSLSESDLDGGITQLTGRTTCDRIVVFPGRERLIGTFVDVRIHDLSGVTLFGEVVTTEGRLPDAVRKGERTTDWNG